MRTHQQLDERSLAMHRMVADKIRRDPALFEQARATLGRWRSIVSSSTQPYLIDWERAMDAGVEVCLALAVENSQRATALRQSSPFVTVLSNKERFDFLRDWKRAHES